MIKIIFAVIATIFICVLVPILVGIGVHMTTNYN